MLGVTVGIDARGLGAGRVLPIDGERPAGEVQAVVDAVSGAAQSIVRIVGVAPRAKRSPRRGMQVELPFAQRHGCGAASILNRSRRRADGQEGKQRGEREKQGKRPLNKMRSCFHRVLLL